VVDDDDAEPPALPEALPLEASPDCELLLAEGAVSAGGVLLELLDELESLGGAVAMVVDELLLGGAPGATTTVSRSAPLAGTVEVVVVSRSQPTMKALPRAIAATELMSLFMESPVG
jgi:hypothetical protein